jgi:transposase
MLVSVIGLDIAKHVFQVHGVDADHKPVLRRKLRRGEIEAFFAALPPCLVGMEACATAHDWARRLARLARLGRGVRLLPPAYVRPYVKRGKSDAADAEAICEAVTRPSMRTVPVKSAEQQAILMLHRTRDLLVRQRTQLANALRSHLAEFGIVARKGLWNVGKLAAILADGQDERIPEFAHLALSAIADQLEQVEVRIGRIEADIVAWHRRSEVSRRLARVPGIGPITASALVASVTDPGAFRSGRDLAAWIGLVPRQNSTGGKERLGRITKQGDRYLRRLLVVGATAVLGHARSRAATGSGWIAGLIARKPARLVTVAIANKMARVAWVLMARGQAYRPTPA